MSGVCNWTVWSAKTLSNSQIILLLISIPSKSISHTTSELIPPETHFWSCHLLLENIPHCFSFADKSITWSPSKNQCLPWGIPTGLIFFFFLVWSSLQVVPYPVFQTGYLMLCTRLSLHATPNLPTCSLTEMALGYSALSPGPWNQVTASATMAPLQIKKPWLARRDRHAVTLARLNTRGLYFPSG